MRIGRTLSPAAAPIYIKDILSGLKGLIKGSKEIDRFEHELKEYYNVKHCFLVSSGKAALTIILRALHELHPDRNEVIIPAFTCYSVPSAILKSGLKIKLCDVNPETLDFDFYQLKKIITQSSSDNLKKSSILAVIPTHLFGLPSNVEQIEKIVAEHEISIIEDAAQSMGGVLNGIKLGTQGDVGFFSLGRGKAFSTVEGGIIITNNEGIAERIIKQMNDIPAYKMLDVIRLVIFSIVLTIFMKPSFFWIPKSLPFLRLGQTLFEPDFLIKKISLFQAGITRGWQKKIKLLIEVRREHINSFCTNRFNSIVKIQSSKLPPSLLRFPIKIKNKKMLDTILYKSEKRGLGIMKAYPKSINNIKELKDYFKSNTYPNATMVSRQLLTLPVHHFLSFSDEIQIKLLINNELGL